jgi:hypothetical protein
MVESAKKPSGSLTPCPNSEPVSANARIGAGEWALHVPQFATAVIDLDQLLLSKRLFADNEMFAITCGVGMTKVDR